MSVAAPPAPVGTLGPDLVAHLQDQIAATKRLLDMTVRQGAAIRVRDVDGVVRLVQDIRVETAGRERLDHERAGLLHRAAVALGIAPMNVTLEDMTALLTADETAVARSRSAELKGALAELQRETQVNRALMRQELTFLDHLLRLAGQPSEPGYRPAGQQRVAASGVPRAAVTARTLDMEA